MKAAVAAVSLLGAGFGTSAWAATVDGEMLLYQKSEPGIEPYPSRIIVTEGHMRLDDGVDGGDFAVLDREARIIYSVTHSDGTVLEIHYRPVDVDSPVELNLQEKQIPTGKDAPAIAGKKPRHYRLLSGDTACYNVVAVPGLLDETVKAMGEFRKIMAGEHAATLPYIPADEQEPCDLGMNIYRHGWLVEHGLPIQEWDGKGNGRTLVNYDAHYRVDSALFDLPEGYRHYSITPDE
jgi:hypothetical protein